MLVGLTGGVATGKSLVAAELKRLGAYIIDADIIARQILFPGEEVYKKVVNEFGSAIVLASGEIDRKKLGAIVFNDKAAIARLNRLTHPVIVRRMKDEAEALLEKEPSALVIFDAPLLIEVGLHKEVERVVVVSCSREEQIRRLTYRDGLTEQEAASRIESQIPLHLKEAHADQLIENNSTVEALLERTAELYAKLIQRDD